MSFEQQHIKPDLWSDSSSDTSESELLELFVINELKEKVVPFLLSDDKDNVLICGTPDVLAIGTRVLKGLQHLQKKSEYQELKSYVGSNQNSFLSCSEFLELYIKPGEITNNSSNLIIVMCTDDSEINQESFIAISEVLRKHLANPLKKVIFVTSDERSLREVIKKIVIEDAAMATDEVQTKTESSSDLNNTCNISSVKINVPNNLTMSKSISNDDVEVPVDMEIVQTFLKSVLEDSNGSENIEAILHAILEDEDPVNLESVRAFLKDVLEEPDPAENLEAVLKVLLEDQVQEIFEHADKEFLIAVLNGDSEKVSKVVKQVTDVNLIVEEQEICNGVSNRYNALYVAARKGYASTIEVLMNHGARFTQKNKTYKDTPLHVATKNNHIDVVKCFLKFKDRINIDTQDNDGETALRLAGVHGYKEIFSILLDANANPNSFNNFGWTALHGAAANNHIEIVDELLSRGIDVDVNSRNNMGSTALIEAAWFGHTEMVDKLLTYDADINAQNNDGKTALHVATKLNHIDTVRKLLERGADATLKDNDGFVALETSKCKSIDDIVRRYLMNALN